MSEEAVVEAPVVEAEPNLQVSPTETQAREQGWVSKEEWVESGRVEDEWRPAKEFVDRGELYKSIHSTKRELKQTQAALDALQRHHQMVYEKAYQDARDDLKVQKRQAIREGDLETLEAVEEKIDKLQEERAKEVQQFRTQQVQTGPAPEFTAFLDKNPWYSVDKGLRDEADAIGFIYLNNGGNKDNLLQHVEKEIRRKFPDKFGVKKAAPNAVAPTSRVGQPKREVDMEMGEGEREIMRTFVRSGIMTEAQYKAELKKAKERG